MISNGLSEKLNDTFQSHKSLENTNLFIYFLLLKNDLCVCILCVKKRHWGQKDKTKTK